MSIPSCSTAPHPNTNTSWLSLSSSHSSELLSRPARPFVRNLAAVPFFCGCCSLPSPCSPRLWDGERLGKQVLKSHIQVCTHSLLQCRVSGAVVGKELSHLRPLYLLDQRTKED